MEKRLLEISLVEGLWLSQFVGGIKLIKKRKEEEEEEEEEERKRIGPAL